MTLVEDTSGVSVLAELTATAPDSLRRALLTRTVAAGAGELIEKGHSSKEAAYARDACAKVGVDSGWRVPAQPVPAPLGHHHPVLVLRPSMSGSSAGSWGASTLASLPAGTMRVCTVRARSSACSTSTALRSLTPTGDVAQREHGEGQDLGGMWCGTGNGKGVWRGWETPGRDTWRGQVLGRCMRTPGGDRAQKRHGKGTPRFMEGMGLGRDTRR